MRKTPDLHRTRRNEIIESPAIELVGRDEGSMHIHVNRRRKPPPGPPPPAAIAEEFDSVPTEEIPRGEMEARIAALEAEAVPLAAGTLDIPASRPFDPIWTKREDGACTCDLFMRWHRKAFVVAPSGATVLLPFDEHRPNLDLAIRYCLCGRDMDPLLEIDLPDDGEPYCCMGLQKAVVYGRVRLYAGHGIISGGMIQAPGAQVPFTRCLWCDTDLVAYRRFAAAADINP